MLEVPGGVPGALLLQPGLLLLRNLVAYLCFAANPHASSHLDLLRTYAAAPTAAATSSATREWFTKNAALAPEAEAGSALCTALPASPATYTPPRWSPSS
jgi:hypothetical protein